jgi:hypothetical protein
MNLWAKSLGRLAIFAAALFFFSCENENSFLGYPNPNPKFNVTYVELPLSSSVLSVDSIITDNKTVTSIANSVVVVGKYQDDQLGQVKAESYLQVVPSAVTRLPTNAVYDSVSVQFRLNFYGYGFTGTNRIKFNVHEVSNDSLSGYSSVRYRYNDAFQYNPVALGQSAVTVQYDSLKKQFALFPNQQDTVVARGKLSDNLGLRLFNLSSNSDFATADEVKQFIHQIKGLALVPAFDSEGVLGIRILDGFSAVTLHYHTTENNAVKDTLSRNYVFNYASFSNISSDRSGTELSAISQPYQSYQPLSGLRYVQSGSPLITKLDLNDFYKFADQDSNKNVIINSAELIIADVESSGGTDPHAGLVMKIMNDKDQFTNIHITEEREAVSRYYVATDVNHYYVNSDESTSEASFARLLYASDTRQFAGFVTLFVQSLFKQRNDSDGINEKRIAFLGLYPLSPAISSSVTRTMFHAGDVKLRIYYTRPGSNVNP